MGGNPTISRQFRLRSSAPACTLTCAASAAHARLPRARGQAIADLVWHEFLLRVQHEHLKRMRATK